MALWVERMVESMVVVVAAAAVATAVGDGGGGGGSGNDCLFQWRLDISHALRRHTATTNTSCA